MDCVYWMYPKWFQSFVNKCIPKKDTWKLKVWKTKQGVYAFNYPPFVWNEALCNGTEHCIDAGMEYKYGAIPTEGDQFTLIASCVPIDDADTVLHYMTGDNDAYYWDAVNCKQAWLCGMSPVMFGYVPSKIWVKFQK